MSPWPDPVAHQVPPRVGLEVHHELQEFPVIVLEGRHEGRHPVLVHGIRLQSAEKAVPNIKNNKAGTFKKKPA